MIAVARVEGIAAQLEKMHACAPKAALPPLPPPPLSYCMPGADMAATPPHRSDEELGGQLVAPAKRPRWGDPR